MNKKTAKILSKQLKLFTLTEYDFEIAQKHNADITDLICWHSDNCFSQRIEAQRFTFSSDDLLTDF